MKYNEAFMIAGELCDYLAEEGLDMPSPNQQEKMAIIIESRADLIFDSHNQRWSERTSIKRAVFPTKEYIDFLNAWKKFFPRKSQPRPGTSRYRNQFHTRWKDKHFRENWYRALERGSKSTFLQGTGWQGFCVQWFLANETNWQKVLDGNYDDQGNKNGTASALDGQAQAEWEALERWMFIHGSNKPPESLPRIQKAISLAGGYKRLCSMEITNGKIAFKRAYKEAASKK